MRNGPVLLPRVVGRKQAIVGAIANFLQASDDKFGESLLVADLVDEFMRADEYARLAKGSESENRTCRLVSGDL